MPSISKERLNNAEFSELIPHLILDELFLIEVKILKNWTPMFVYLPKKNVINCHICKQKVPLAEFVKHINESDHKEGLTRVEQFYHPVYTYQKKDAKLANGEKVSESELKAAIGVASLASNELKQGDLVIAKHVAKQVKKACGLNDLNFEDALASLAVKKHVACAQEMIVEVSLTLPELLKLEYSTKQNEWKFMMTTDNPHPNAKYLCVLCNRYCHGIITVNSHLNGLQHRNTQLETLGIRLEGRDQVTKYCCFRYDKSYTLCVKREGRELLKNEAQTMLSERTLVSMLECDEGKEKDFENDLNNVRPPELSAVVKEKAKVLAAERPAIANEKDCSEQIDKEGLIGVEYVVKLLKCPNDPAPEFECCLCEVALNESRMQSHLINYNHRLKYCEMHYPHTTQKLKERIGRVKFSEYFRIMSFILSKIARAIEDYHGRSIPYSIPTNKFARARPEIVAKVYSLKHASETHGPNFLQVVSQNEFSEIRVGTITYKTPTVPSAYRGRFNTTPAGKIYLDQRHHDPHVVEDHAAKSANIAQSKASIIRSPSPKFSKSQRQPPQGRDLWKVYREEISTAASAIERSYMEYRKHPESHPSYDHEWNRFWRQRKEELMGQGVDHRSYNYQPEWVHYFRDRLEELFSEELQKSKVDVRRRLNIPLDAEEDSKPQTTTFRSSESSNYKRSFKESRSLDDDAQPVTKKPNFSQNISQNNRSVNNMQPNNSMNWNEDANNSKGAWAETSATCNEIGLIVPNDKPNVIHALRLLTALEDHLGSLGGKIMELLSKALVLEKTIGDVKDLNQRILTASNCSLLETAMEKLKGLLFAGLLDSSKVQGFNRVIDHTTSILKYAEKMGWTTNIVESSEKINSSSTSEIQKLIEVLQKKEASNMGSLSQKSLSDTLMELIAGQKKPIQPNSQSGSLHKRDINSFAQERSNFEDSNSMNLYKPQGQQYNTDEVNRNRFSNFSGNFESTRNSGFSSDNSFTNTSFERNEFNQMAVTALNKNSMRTSTQPSFGNFNNYGSMGQNLTGSVNSGGGGSGGGSGGGRNSYNNPNYNSNFASPIGNMKPMAANSRVDAFTGLNSGSNFQGYNKYAQMPGMNRGTNFLQNLMGNMNPNSNWNRNQNNNHQ